MWAYSFYNLHFLQVLLLVGFQAWDITYLDWCTHSFCPYISRAVIPSLFFISLDPNTSVRSSGREGNRKPPLSQTKGLLSQDTACLPSTGQKQMRSVRGKPGHRDPSPVIPCVLWRCLRLLVSLSQQKALQAVTVTHITS